MPHVFRMYCCILIYGINNTKKKRLLVATNSKSKTTTISLQTPLDLVNSSRRNKHYCNASWVKIMINVNYLYKRGRLAYRQLRARRALLQIKDVPLRNRRALSPYTLYINSALLVLNGSSQFTSINQVKCLFWPHI